MGRRKVFGTIASYLVIALQNNSSHGLRRHDGGFVLLLDCECLLSGSGKYVCLASVLTRSIDQIDMNMFNQSSNLKDKDQDMQGRCRSIDDLPMYPASKHTAAADETAGSPS